MKAQMKAKLLETLSAKNTTGNGIFSRAQIIDAARECGINSTPSFLLYPEFKVDGQRGKYDISPHLELVSARPVAETVAPVAEPTSNVLTQRRLAMEIENLIPAADVTFVKFGFYNDLKKILKTQMFYPIFISGLSGNGKTTMVEQVCADLKREAIRVNISVETDEDDLIGGNTLVDGNVVFREGPVLTAMKRGSVLILDEVDRGSNKLMCLQAICEGKPYFNKKTGDTITPARGFTVIATANTKGRGSDDGKFISTQILDEAFLERFAITVEQEYPTPSVEKKIIINKMDREGCTDNDFADHLVAWSNIIRKTYYEGGVEEIISTRRLEHIVKAFAVFGDRLKAIELCIARFDEETKSAFQDLYTKLDGTDFASLTEESVVSGDLD